jgi:two-component system, NtrC family, sensor histidine kinase PilS
MTERQNDKNTEAAAGLPYARKPLHFLNLYRITLAGLLLVLALAGSAPAVLGSTDPLLFRVVSGVYLLFAVTSSFLIRAGWPRLDVQVRLQVLGDILALTLLMHASGGVTSGIGMLMVVAVAAGSLLMAGRMATLFAAVATLAVLGQHGYAQLLRLEVAPPAYMHAGLLGAAFFATALLAHVLARRVRESEALAVQRGIDLANMAQLNETIIQRMQSGVVVADHEDRVRLMNESAWFLLGMPALGEGEAIGSVSSELAEQLQAWRAAPSVVPRTFRPASGAADVLPRFARLGSGGTSGSLIFLEDTAVMAQQAQQMKLASLGRLTASIAHEIRNPLGAISHAAQLLAESPLVDGGDRRLTEIVLTQSQRINAIVEDVLQLSRRERSQPLTFALRPWLESFVQDLCESEHVDASRIALEIEPAGVQVSIDPGHLHHTLTNLCRNALQHGGGAGRTARLVLRGGVTRDLPGPFLDVIDNGPGIDPALAEQIFEPFFTTRARGTGLGLYIARELTEYNRASLAYLPVPTGGSCFRIAFPDPHRQALHA